MNWQIPLCVPGMARVHFFSKMYTDYPEGASPLWASWRSPLVSRKGVPGDRKSEGSGTTKVCTDEQKLHTRHSFVGEQPHLCEARSQYKLRYVDAAAIDSKDKCLTRGDLDAFVEKSAEAIVP